MINDYVSYLSKNFSKWGKFLDYMLDITPEDKFFDEEHKESFRMIMWAYRDYIYDLHLMHPSYTSGVSQFTKQLELTNKLFTYCDRMFHLGDVIPQLEKDKWAKVLNDALDDFFSKELNNVIPKEEKAYYQRMALERDADLSHHLSSRYNLLKSQENIISNYTTTSTGLG